MSGYVTATIAGENTKLYLFIPDLSSQFATLLWLMNHCVVGCNGTGCFIVDTDTGCYTDTGCCILTLGATLTLGALH